MLDKRGTRAHTRNNAINNFNHLLSCKRSTRALTLNMNNKKNKFLPKSKRSQITIFIIAAIILVAIVVLFLIFKGKANEKPDSPFQETINPESFLKSCINDKVKETLKTLSYQGGYIENPLSIKFKFGSEPYYNISYLCYTSANYLPCIVQQPSIINHMEGEIHSELEEELENCFNEMTESYTEKGYSANKDYNDFEADLIESGLKINLDAKLTLTKTGDTIRKNDFKISFPGELYDVGKIVNLIIESETKYGSFDYLTYSSIYYKYNIELYKTSDQTDIYTIENKDSKEKFRFAVKGNILPT